MKDHNSTTNQNIKRKLVKREVIHLASSMVFELVKKAEQFPEWENELYSAFDGGEDEEGNQIEIFEHWIITEWFGEKLSEHGEKVFELFDFTIWARSTTGQAILLDHVISEIAEKMEILEGQKNEWK